MSAEQDRDTALADRGVSATDRESSSHDALTGTYLRGPGMVELDRDMDRAARAKQPVVLAFVDVDGLKAVNDARGHAAGDRTLAAVAGALRAVLRSHDLVVRYGGDEFVCAMAGLDLTAAKQRLAEGASVTVGLAELRVGETSGDLVARADAELYRRRQQLRGG